MLTHSIYSVASRAKELFSQLPTVPRHDRGQNFMVNTKVIESLLNNVTNLIGQDESIVEIGGGLGAFSVPLATLQKPCTVYEIDPFLFPILSHVMEKYTNAIVSQTDILEIRALSSTHKTVFVFGSLPYAITSPILHRLIIEWFSSWRAGIFIIQKEVAEKIMTSPPDGSYWNNFVENFYAVNRIETISASSFWPQPGVESVAISLVKRENEGNINPREWSTFLHAVFLRPRKSIRSTIGPHILEKVSIDGIRRPQEISRSELLNLFQVQKLERQQ